MYCTFAFVNGMGVYVELFFHVERARTKQKQQQSQQQPTSFDSKHNLYEPAKGDPRAHPRKETFGPTRRHRSRLLVATRADYSDHLVEVLVIGNGSYCARQVLQQGWSRAQTKQQ